MKPVSNQKRKMSSSRAVFWYVHVLYFHTGYFLWCLLITYFEVQVHYQKTFIVICMCDGCLTWTGVVWVCWAYPKVWRATEWGIVCVWCAPHMVGKGVLAFALWGCPFQLPTPPTPHGSGQGIMDSMGAEATQMCYYVDVQTYSVIISCLWKLT